MTSSPVTPASFPTLRN